MRVFGEKLTNRATDTFFLAMRPRHTQHTRYKPGLEHQSDIDDGDVGEIHDWAKMGMANLIRLVNALDWDGNDGRAHPRGPHHKFQFKGVAPRPNFQLLRQGQRVTTKTTLRIPQPHPCLNVKPKRRD